MGATIMITIEEARRVAIEEPGLVSSGGFDALTRPLIGLKVALARQAYGSVLMIEMGRLTQGTGPRWHLRGEASLVFEWHWRFEAGSDAVFGSSSEAAFIYAQLIELRGQRVTGIRLEGRFPELILELSGGLRARSLPCVEEDPGWWLWLPDKSSLHWEEGTLRHEGPAATPRRP
jgi:hypothetical protein